MLRISFKRFKLAFEWLESLRTNRLCFAYCSTNYTLAQCVQQYNSRPLLHVGRYMQQVTFAWVRLLFWDLCTHAQLNPFYRPFYLDVTHVRKDTKPSSHFSVLQATESWVGPGNGAMQYHCTNTIQEYLTKLDVDLWQTSQIIHYMLHCEIFLPLQAVFSLSTFNARLANILDCVVFSILATLLVLGFLCKYLIGEVFMFNLHSRGPPLLGYIPQSRNLCKLKDPCESHL